MDRQKTGEKGLHRPHIIARFNVILRIALFNRRFEALSSKYRSCSLYISLAYI